MLSGGGSTLTDPRGIDIKFSSSPSQHVAPFMLRVNLAAGRGVVVGVGMEVGGRGLMSTNTNLSEFIFTVANWLSSLSTPLQMI